MGSRQFPCRFLTTAADTLRYPQFSLIRFAAASRLTADSVVTAFPTAQKPSQAPAKVELAPMLPGFRFLLAAILLSMSILVFGLGAAALLRAAHEEFAGNPAWHGTPETTFAQQREAARPILAMLRVETPLVEKPAIEKPVAEKPSEDIPAPAAPAALPDADTTATNIAAPEGLPLAIDVLPRARPTIATPDASIIKKRLQARRAAQRRRIAAARARLAQQALLLQQQQQALNPFFRT